jgi:hypothetical protein
VLYNAAFGFNYVLNLITSTPFVVIVEYPDSNI